MDHQRIVEVFDHIAPILSDRIGGPAHLVRIVGPRWSYVAGHIPSELPFVEPQRVMLEGEWGILYYPQPGRKIDPEEVRRLFLEAKGTDDEA